MELSESFTLRPFFKLLTYVRKVKNSTTLKVVIGSYKKSGSLNGTRIGITSCSIAQAVR